MEDRKGEHPFGDAGQLVLVAMFLIVWVVDSFVLHLSTFLKPHDPHSIRMIATVLAASAAVGIFLSSRQVIHRVRPDYVVDTGPFHYVRHPLYLACMLGFAAFAVSSLSLVSMVLLVPIFLFYNYIAGFEERVLETRFGDAYVAYKARTGKWLPRMNRRTGV